MFLLSLTNCFGFSCPAALPSFLAVPGLESLVGRVLQPSDSASYESLALLETPLFSPTPSVDVVTRVRVPCYSKQRGRLSEHGGLFSNNVWKIYMTLRIKTRNKVHENILYLRKNSSPFGYSSTSLLVFLLGLGKQKISQYTA